MIGYPDIFEDHVHLARPDRFYDPYTGQFVSRDPLNVLTHSPYGYVQGDGPLNYTDPSGLCGVWGADSCVGNAASGAVDHVDNAVREFKKDHGICTTDDPNCVPLKDSTTAGKYIFIASVAALIVATAVLLPEIYDAAVSAALTPAMAGWLTYGAGTAIAFGCEEWENGT